VGYSLGFDLGTTFVAAAITSASRVEMVTLGDRSVVIPAAVHLREDGILITGEAAGRHAVSSPDRVSREVKRRLGNPTPVILGGQPYDVIPLLGILLRDVLQKVIETEGAPPDRVMLTHPANWGPFRRALFGEVPRHAGLTKLPMVTEPEAAAAHYAATGQLADGQTVAVYDLGGGTFDAAVLHKQPGGIEILGTPEGIDRLGGIDFDEAILSYVDYAAGGALSELDLRDPLTHAVLARLRQDCTLAKEALSVHTEATVPVSLPGRHLDVRLTRSDFEDIVRAPIESTIGALSRTLQSAQVTPADLSAVLLVGGSSRIPLVAQMVSAGLGRPTVVDTHPQHTVALGAATLAAAAPRPRAGTIFTTPYQPRDTRPPPQRPAVVAMPTPLVATPPRPPAAEPVRWSLPRRHWLPLAGALGIAIVVTALVWLGLLIVGTGADTARLELSTRQVTIGDSYVATASGFSPGEGVQFSWTGPTDGVLDIVPASSDGRTSHRIVERHPPGKYTIFVIGLTSKRTARAALDVVQPGNAR
jgi:actin-like ATPase involved in cell morphogenesis